MISHMVEEIGPMGSLHLSKFVDRFRVQCLCFSNNEMYSDWSTKIIPLRIFKRIYSFFLIQLHKI